MPRTYVRRPGSRNYRNYSIETLNEALDEIKKKKISIRGAAVKYGIHRSSLVVQMREKLKREYGGQNIFSIKEELLFIKRILCVPTISFPLIINDLPIIMKSYLDKKHKQINIFKDNLPHLKWVNVFIERHEKLLRNKIAKNVTHSRAIFDEKAVIRFFNYLKDETYNVPPCNIWNFDDTNLVNDPESLHALVKRRTKYPEKFKKSPETCTKLMLCINARGEVAPVRIDYDENKMWRNWEEHDPNNVTHNRAQAAWFNFQCFEDWFLSELFPLLKRQKGKKIILCNSDFSSHFNLDIINVCNKHNIIFVSLPPKSNNFLQPLNSGFFMPLRIEWRSILNAWKNTPSGHIYPVIPNAQFPPLLTELLDSLKDKSSKNITSAFRKCGIYPFNRNIVLQRLTASKMTLNTYERPLQSKKSLKIELKSKSRIQPVKMKEKQENVLPKVIRIKLLRQRFDTDQSTKINKKIAMPRISDEIKINISSDEDSKSFPLLATVTSENSKNVISSSSSLSNNFNLQNHHFSSSEYSNGSINEMSIDDCTVIKIEELSFSVDEFIVVKCDGEYIPGKITKIRDNRALVNTMLKCGTNWTWSNRSASNWYDLNDLKAKIDEPLYQSKDRIFEVPEINKFTLLDNLFL